LAENATGQHLWHTVYVKSLEPVFPVIFYLKLRVLTHCLRVTIFHRRRRLRRRRWWRRNTWRSASWSW